MAAVIRHAFAASISLCILGGSASAITIGELLDSCESILQGSVSDSSASAYDQGLCMGIAQGVGTVLVYNCTLSGDQNVGQLPMIEAPQSYGSAIRSFVEWANSNQELHSENAVDGFIAALLENFPCHS